MRAYATPLLVSHLGEDHEHCLPLQALPMRPGNIGTHYDERWVQMLIHRQPNLLPMDRIEPSLTPLVPLCVELPTPSGYADNLLMTPDGGIVLVEAKLWRNPQARREVVGQVLDYAKDLSRWSYEDLEQAVRIARQAKNLRLFHLVCGHAEPEDEATFIDAVSRNLRLGRFALIIAGDGIQDSAEQLTDFLQRHVGLHFTLAMVELSLWRTPVPGQVIVQPKVVARTVQIERAVVRVEEGVSLTPANIQPSPAGASRPSNISEETFYEELAKADPILPARLRAFLDQVEPLGVFAEVKRNLSLKWRSPQGPEFNLGLIDLNGRLQTDHAQWSAYIAAQLELGTRYQQALAAIVPGARVRKTAKQQSWRVVVGDKNPPLALFLDNAEAWATVIGGYITSLEQAL